MKINKKISRIFALIAISVLLCSLLVLPTFADDTAVYQDAYYQFCETYGIHTLSRYPLDLFAHDYGYDTVMGYDTAYVFPVYTEDWELLYENSIVQQVLENEQSSYDYEIEGIAGAICKPDNADYYIFENAMYAIYVDGLQGIVLEITQGDFTFLRLEYSWDNANRQFYLNNAILFEDVLANHTQLYFAFLVPDAKEQNEAFELLQTSTIERLSPSAFYNGYTNAPEGGAGTVVMGGMYRDLYTILKGGIYGEGAILDANQNFVLTQLSTYLAYAVCLLPLIVTVCIAIKLWRW